MLVYLIDCLLFKLTIVLKVNGTLISMLRCIIKKTIQIMKYIKKLSEILKKNRMFISISFVAAGCSVILWFLLRGYFFEGFINPETEINLDNASKIGDFIGGFVGVIFTLVGVLLLYETLALQRKELTDSRKVFEKQQFENTFFSLLDLYQNIVNSLHYEDFTGIQSTGKEFFKTQKALCIFNYTPSDSFYKNRLHAIETYTKFYIEHKESISHYFRTLYRIFRIIEVADLSLEDKIFYAKIVRAQLSESELFMINYNACTPYGKKFRPIIVSYNLIKHLPILERLEFSEWRNKISPEKVNSLNQLFIEIIEYLKSCIQNPNVQPFYKTYLKGKFALRINCLKSSITVKLYRNNRVIASNFIQQGFGLDDFSNEELEKLLKCFLVEIIKNSNYEILNDGSKIKFATDTVQDFNDPVKFEIFATVSTINGLDLKLIKTN